jgi:hypothetical protein
MVVEGKKGHFSNETHIVLLKRVQTLLPRGSDVILIEDGVFDRVVVSNCNKRHMDIRYN